MNDDDKAAWLEGQTAGSAGRSGDANPYPAGTETNLDWQDGWLEGAKQYARHKEPRKMKRL